MGNASSSDIDCYVPTGYVPTNPTMYEALMQPAGNYSPSHATLQGDAGDNQIQGWDGDDTIRGGLGDDTLDGDLGTDTVSYSDITGGGVDVNLEAGTATGAAGAWSGGCWGGKP